MAENNNETITAEEVKADAKPEEKAAEYKIDIEAAQNKSVFASEEKEEKKLFNIKLPSFEKNDNSEVYEKLAEKVSEIKDNDTKILAELLLELKKDQEAESAYAKRHMMYSIITSILSFALVIICMVSLIPMITGLVKNLNSVLDNTNKLVVEAEAIVDQAQDVFDQTDIIIKNLSKTTDELAATDFEGIMNNVGSLVTNTQGTLDEAMNKITSIDIDTLNNSIKGLNDVIEPLSKFFGGGSSSNTTKKKSLFGL